MGDEGRYKDWLSGVRFLIYTRGVMTQAKLARETGAAREHINAVLRGRTDAGQNLQSQITAALGKTYDDLCALGRSNLEMISFAPEDSSAGGITSAVRQISKWWQSLRNDNSTDALSLVRDDARVIYDVVMNGNLVAIKSWWTETEGDGEHSAMIFMNRFRQQFPEFEHWEKQHEKGDGKPRPAPIKAEKM